MLFSIDKTRIDELLAESKPPYVVTSTLMDAQPAPFAEQISASVYGTISNPSADRSEDDWPYARTTSPPGSGAILKSLIVQHRQRGK